MSTRHQDLQGGAPAQAGHPTALSHAERLQQPSGHHLDPTADHGHRSRGQAASPSRTRCHSPRRRREKPTHPSARVRQRRTRVALAPGDTLRLPPPWPAACTTEASPKGPFPIGLLPGGNENRSWGTGRRAGQHGSDGEGCRYGVVVRPRCAYCRCCRPEHKRGEPSRSIRVSPPGFGAPKQLGMANESGLLTDTKGFRKLCTRCIVSC